MDRTEQTVRYMLAALEAPLYDVGVLSSRGMLSGLDQIPASAVLDKLRLLKFRNARGSHIYIRPSGEHFRTPGELARELSSDEFRLYELIWKRTIASQMIDAVGQSVSVRLSGTSSTG